MTIDSLRRTTAALMLAVLLTPVSAPAACPDCDGDGSVAINELITGIGIALGSTPLGVCPTFDRDADGVVAIDELVAGIGAALDGCEDAATPTPSPSQGPTPMGLPPTEPVALLTWP